MTAIVVTVDDHDVRVTSPDKPFFPGLAKRDLVDYYVRVGHLMIEHLRDRPTTLERWPDGVFEGAESFYQKHVPRSLPDFVERVPVTFPSGRPGVMIRPTTPAVIVWAAQMSTVTFHPWASRHPTVSAPDELRLDFDPSPGSGFAEAVAAANLARDLMDGWAWPSFVKTSGGRGVHVYVPIQALWTPIDVRHAAIAIARELERRAPELITSSWWKEERGDRVFIDFNQNAQDRSIASAFSVRANAEATVSMPVAWSTLGEITPTDFTLRTVPGIVDGAGWVDPWAVMRERPVGIEPALDLWEADVERGLPELPYPPDFPKMPGEPPRVAPSRARQD